MRKVATRLPAARKRRKSRGANFNAKAQRDACR